MIQKGDDMKKTFPLSFRDVETAKTLGQIDQSIMLNWNTELGALGMTGAGRGFNRN